MESLAGRMSSNTALIVQVFLLLLGLYNQFKETMFVLFQYFLYKYVHAAQKQ
jgi:hypothetical protein